MKTQYFRRARRLISPAQSIALAIAAAVFILLALLRGIFPGAFIALATPFLRAGDFFAAHLRLSGSASELAAKADRLEAQIETLRNENRILAAKAGEDADEGTKGIVAGVIARPPLSPYDVLIVGKGSADGVYAGMRVLSKGVPVGTVESVSARSARIALYSASGSANEGWIGKERIPVTLRGLGAGAFTADVPREAAIAEGDAVYLPGPGALPVGTVAAVESGASSPRATLSIRPLANPFTMDEVVIVAAPSL